MAIIRVEKTKDYTVMSNHHLRDKNLSLKAKGLMSLMLSLPDEWDYSIEGLVKISKENKTAIQSALKELEGARYLQRTCVHLENGQFDYEYNLSEKPQTGKPQTGKPQPENPCTVNRPQLNTNIINTDRENKDELNTNYINEPPKKEQKHKYGTYGRVLLTDKQLEKLKEDFGEEFILQAIDRLDEYIQSNNNKNHYTDFNLVLRKAIREKWSLLADIKGFVTIESKKKNNTNIFDNLLREAEEEIQ